MLFFTLLPVVLEHMEIVNTMVSDVGLGLGLGLGLECEVQEQNGL